MAILAADGIGNIIQTYLLPQMPSIQGTEADQFLILAKIFVFILVIVLLSIKGGFYVDIMNEQSAVTRILATLSFGFINAGLIVSTILVYVSGSSFVGGSLKLSGVTNLYEESQMVRIMIDNYNIWFAIPAIAFVLISLFEPKEGNQ